MEVGFDKVAAGNKLCSVHSNNEGVRIRQVEEEEDGVSRRR